MNFVFCMAYGINIPSVHFKITLKEYIVKIYILISYKNAFD